MILDCVPNGPYFQPYGTSKKDPMTGAAHRLPDPAEVTPELRDYQRAIRTGEPEEHRYVTLLGLTQLDPLGLAREVERGLPYRASDRLLRNSALSRHPLALLVTVA